jgi:DNA primase
MTIETQRQSRDALIRELEAAGATVRGAAISCPFHDDQHPSGGVYQDGEGVWRFKCHACHWHGDLYDVRAKATGQPLDDILREANPDAGKRRQSKARQETVYPTVEDLRLAVSREPSIVSIEAEYSYRHPDTGTVEMLVFRCRTADDKTFRQSHPVKGGWVKRASPKPWPLYNRARVRAADTVVVVEGEKTVHALHDVGIVATTSPGGAGKAEHCDWSPLAGKKVILWPDNDTAGREHLDQVAAIIEQLEANASNHGRKERP